MHIFASAASEVMSRKIIHKYNFYLSNIKKINFSTVSRDTNGVFGAGAQHY